MAHRRKKEKRKNSCRSEKDKLVTIDLSIPRLSHLGDWYFIIPPLCNRYYFYTTLNIILDNNREITNCEIK